MSITKMTDHADAIREFAAWKRGKEAMSQKIWQVKVYEDNGADYTLYHFTRKEDVLDSISKTWSQNPKSIHWNRTDPDAILITNAEDRTKVLVLAEAIEFELLTRSTHF